mgnify:CR=1 FL=1
MNKKQKSFTLDHETKQRLTEAAKRVTDSNESMAVRLAIRYFCDLHNIPDVQPQTAPKAQKGTAK